MAGLSRKIVTLHRVLHHYNVNHQSVRCAIMWPHEMKPGPYPKTRAEREAAARKYNMVYEDYEPYPDDGTGYGDYPNVPLLSPDLRDPYEPWDFPTQRRNFNEVLPVDDDMYTMDRCSSHWTYNVPKSTMYLMVLSMVAVYALAVYLGQDTVVTLRKIQKKKQYPFTGEEHYTFEPATD